MKNSIEILPEKEYQWNQNWAARIAHTDISLVVKEIEEIIEVRGEISPELVIESSRNKKSVLHDYFQWDDAKAAHSWRLRQAATLLSRIEVKIIKDGEPKVIRVYQTVSKANSLEWGMPAQYKTFDSLSLEDIDFIKKRCIEDLFRVKNRLISHSISHSISHIEKAIEELSKESTETKEEGQLLLGLGKAVEEGSVAAG